MHTHVNMSTGVTVKVPALSHVGSSKSCDVEAHAHWCINNIAALAHTKWCGVWASYAEKPSPAASHDGIPIPIIRIHKMRQDYLYQAAHEFALSREVGQHSERGMKQSNMTPQSTYIFTVCSNTHLGPRLSSIHLDLE